MEKDRLVATGIKLHLRELLQQKAQREGRDSITHDEIVAATGISRPTVSNWIKNRVDRLDIDILVRFCNYLQCDISDLMTLEG